MKTLQVLIFTFFNFTTIGHSQVLTNFFLPKNIDTNMLVTLSAGESLTIHKVVRQAPYGSVGVSIYGYGLGYELDFTYPGPLELSLEQQALANVLVLVIASIRNNAQTSNLVVPQNGIVLPSENSGPVTVTLESSSDLISWFPASPGEYGGYLTNRFFRVKAVFGN